MGRRSEAAASGVLRRKAQFSSAERHRAPRLKREIYRFNDELKRKYFPRRADRDRGARFFFGDGPVAGGAATKLRPPRGAAEGRAICDRGFRAAVRFFGWRRFAKGRSWPSFGLRILLSRSRCFASPALSVPLGTPIGVLHSLKGGGRRAELSCPSGPIGVPLGTAPEAELSLLVVCKWAVS